VSVQELLSVEVSIRYGDVVAADAVAFSLRSGSVLALIGESGSGKTSIGLSILALLPRSARVSGSIRFAGEELITAGERRMRGLRGSKIAYIPQDAAACLNPFKTVRQQLWAFWKLGRHGAEKSEFERVLQAALSAVRLESALAGRYPRELSIGQCQRVAIANAVLRSPELIIADEPTSALDPITAAEVMSLLGGLRSDGRSLLLISHDLAAVSAVADEVGILHKGRLVESGDTGRIFRDPHDEYTKALIQAIPRISFEREMAGAAGV